LRDQWANSYGAERVSVLWNAFQTVPDGDFCDAVTECLANHRAAPLVKEIGEEVNKTQARSAENRTYTGMSESGFGRVLAETARRAPNKEFARECITLLHKKETGQISDEQFQQGCDYLDQAATLSNPNECPRCANTGYNTQDKMLYRCSCPIGQMRPEKAFGPLEKNGTRSEHFIPMLTKSQWKKPSTTGRDKATGEKDDAT